MIRAAAPGREAADAPQAARGRAARRPLPSAAGEPDRPAAPAGGLAGLIDRGRFEAEFGALYTDGGRPGLPTRLMVGLHLLKHMDGLSDEAVCARYLDSPYAQLFCG